MKAHDSIEAQVMGMFLQEVISNRKYLDNNKISFTQTYSLRQAEKKFGNRATKAAQKELGQLDERTAFEPILLKDLSEDEKAKAMEILLFLVEKRDGALKARGCADGSIPRSYIDKEEAASPTVATDSVLITGTTEAKHNRDIMTIDMPNAFVQTDVPEGIERIIMKIRGRLVDILLEINEDKYKPYVHDTKNGKVIYVRLTKMLCGMLKSSLMYYEKFTKDTKENGYEINPYDVCVANKIINNHQHAITWHVDDVKSSHIDPAVNDSFAKWCDRKHGSVGKVKVKRGLVHDYLGMNLDYTDKGKLRVDMRKYIEEMIKEFPQPVSNSKSPWNGNLFKVDDSSPPLTSKEAETFHTFTMKGMFLVKRARPDMEPGFGFLSTRVRNPAKQDMKKLTKLLGYLKTTVNDVLTLEADDLGILYWHVDASFAVHHDMKSHTGSVFTLGKGAIASSSTKQKINARSTTESELIGVDDKISKIIWSRKFIEHQGFKVKVCIIYQDNTSTIKLLENGRGSTGKRTRHFDIRLFYKKDLIDRKELIVKYCPTEEMLADYMSQPVVGYALSTNRERILNLSPQ